MAIVTVGIDLAKNIFAVRGVDAAGKAMASVGVRLTAQLGTELFALMLCFILESRTCQNPEFALPITSFKSMMESCPTSLVVPFGLSIRYDLGVFLMHFTPFSYSIS